MNMSERLGDVWPRMRVIGLRVGALVLLLLFVGIHNAWDTVTHLVFVRRRGQR